VDMEAQAVWGKVWPETLSGSSTGTKITALIRVLPVIETGVCALLSDLSWARRRQGVAVLKDLTKSLGSTHLSPSVGVVVELLLGLIPGQVWNGQAQTLEVLTALMSKCFATHNVGRDIE
jgi:hypothetical protein